MAAMVALQASAETVLDQPGIAIRAFQTVAAGPAQGQRGIAAAVQEQQHLFAGLERLLHRPDQARRQPALALGRVAAQVDGADLGQHGLAEPVVQGHPAVAPRLDIGERFQRRRGRGEDDRNPAQRGAGDGHVAGLVEHAVLLLEGGLVLLVDDDQPEPRKGQEQRRAGADHDGRPALGDRPPGLAPLAGGDFGMPDHGRRPEALREAVQPLSGQGDLGQQHQHLAAGRQPVGDRLEIDFRLARTGYPVEQAGGEAGFKAVAQGSRGLGLAGAQGRSRPGRIGHRDRGFRRQGDGLQRACRDQAADHAAADSRKLRQFRRGSRRRVDQRVDYPAARRRHAFGRRTAEAVAGPRQRRFQRRGHAHCHAQHAAAVGAAIVGDPVEKAPGHRAHGGHRKPAGHGLQAVVRQRRGRIGGALAPDHAAHQAPAQRHLDEIARRRGALGIEGIVVVAAERQRQPDMDPPRAHGRRSGAVRGGRVGRFRPDPR